MEVVLNVKIKFIEKDYKYYINKKQIQQVVKKLLVFYFFTFCNSMNTYINNFTKK